MNELGTRDECLRVSCAFLADVQSELTHMKHIYTKINHIQYSLYLKLIDLDLRFDRSVFSLSIIA
jgi:hypothetical protein